MVSNQLDESKFIHEGYTKDPSPLWIWLAVIAALGLLTWAGQSWYYQWMEKKLAHNPFLQVTNRDFSLFLWQNPEHMRVNAKQKTGYLPAFQYIDKVTLDPLLAEDFVEAPPSLLFLYHTWRRLLYKEFTPHEIPVSEFKQFIEYTSEWQPEFWHKAPQEYVDFVNRLLKEDSFGTQEKTVPLQLIPFEVQRAFQGWKNFFIDKEAINQILPTVKQMREFLNRYPHYMRNFWQNILQESVPNYLKEMEKEQVEEDRIIPTDQLAPFLKAGFYNSLKDQRE